MLALGFGGAHAQPFVAADGEPLASKGDVLDALAKVVAVNEAALPDLPPRAADGGGAVFEAAAARLVRPWQLGGPVAQGWTLRHAGEGQDGLRYLLVPRAGAGVSPLEVVLVSLKVRRGCYFKTEYYCGYYRGGDLGRRLGGAPGPPVLGEVCEPGAPRAEEVAAAARGRTVFRALLAGLVLLLVGLTALLLRRRAALAPPPRWAWVGLLALTTLALVLRWQVSPWTFLHEFYRIGDTVTQYLWTDSFQLYGETGPALYRMMDALFGGEEQAIFATNAVLASLSVPAVALLDLALFGRWGRALVAGLCLCVLPLHLRFSASEELFIPGLCFLVWSLALCVDYARTRSWLSLMAAMLAMSLCAQSRPELLLTPLHALLLVLALWREKAWRVLWSWQTLAGVAVLGLITAPRLWALVTAPDGDAPQLRELGRHLLTEQVVFDGRWTPPVLWGLALLGLAAGLRQSVSKTLWVVVLLLCLGAAPLLFFDLPVYCARTQVVAAPFFALLVAGALPAVLGVCAPQGWVRAALAGLCALVIVWTSWSHRAVVVEEKDQQEEWAFLRDALPRLRFGPHAELLTLTRNAGNLYLGSFPWFLLRRAGHEVSLLDLRDLLEADALPPPHPGLVFYQGTYCYYRNPEEPPGRPFNRRCEAVRRRYHLRPLLVHELRTGPYAHLDYADQQEFKLEIGFYAASPPPPPSP